MGAVRELCQRAIWLSGGRVEDDGPVEDVIQRYIRTATDSTFTYSNSAYGFTVDSIVLKNSAGERTLTFEPGEDLTVEILLDARAEPAAIHLVEHYQHWRTVFRFKHDPGR